MLWPMMEKERTGMSVLGEEVVEVLQEVTIKKNPKVT